MSSIRSSRGPVGGERSTRDGFTKGFYGTQPAPQRKPNGTFSLIKKKKQTSMESDVRSACKSLDAYKESADKLHSALMWMLVQSKNSAESLATTRYPAKMPADPAYKYLSDYLVTFDNAQKASTKVPFESLEPAVAATKKMQDELEQYMKKQLDTLKPLVKFIGDEYWEYAKQKAAYQTALEKVDAAQQAKSKQGSAESEQSVLASQKTKEEAKAKMMALLTKIMAKRDQHAQCVLKFTKVAAEFHKTAASILSPFNIKDPEQSAQSAEKSCEKSAEKSK